MTEETEVHGVSRKFELRIWHLAAIYVFACCVIVSRRPDAVFHAQFWAEDGFTFFGDAYNLGWWPALFLTHTGYFMTLPRLAAGLALLVPLHFAPLLLNLIAIGFQALPVIVLLSQRSAAWGSLRTRTLMAVVLLALPNCWEIDANITNAHSYLALSAFLLIVASRPLHAWERIFDLGVLLLCVLSGPFCLFLFPVALCVLWRHRDLWRAALVAIISAGCFIQVWALLFVDRQGRPHYELGASPVLFARIVAGQVYLGTLVGGLGQPPHMTLGLTAFFIAVAIAGTVFTVICFFRTSLVLKLFLAFSAMLTVAPMLSATLRTLHGVTAWDVLVGGGGNRYWFIPALAFGWAIIWCFESPSSTLKPISIVLMFVMCFGIAFRWRYPSFPESHFAEYAKQFEAAPPGTQMTIPQAPPAPPGWTLQLVKHAPH